MRIVEMILGTNSIEALKSSCVVFASVERSSLDELILLVALIETGSHNSVGEVLVRNRFRRDP